MSTCKYLKIDLLKSNYIKSDYKDDNNFKVCYNLDESNTLLT